MSEQESPANPVLIGWDIIETALKEAGVIGPPTESGVQLGMRSQAEQVSKAIVARLAAHDPPILLAFGHELKDGS